jgi:Leucine rich repeat
VAAVRHAEGHVAYDWEHVHRSTWSEKLIYPRRNRKPIWPEWLVHALEEDYFGDVVTVSFLKDLPGKFKSQATDDVMSGRLDVRSRGTRSISFLADILIPVKRLRPSTQDARMTDQANTASRPWRRFLRFSVRGLIVLVLVVGGGLGWLVRSARVQREAVAAITEAGGLVQYDWEWREGSDVPRGKPRAPTWLVNLIGVDFFGHVTDVRFFSLSKATDATFVHVGRLTQLERLHVFRWSLGDAGLAHLKGMTKLSSLVLCSTQLTDACLAHLKGMTSLTSLHLTDTQITDAGLVHLKGLTKLSYLNLRGARISGVGPVHLKGLNNLSELSLYGTQITDAAVNELRQALPSLKIYH